MKTKKSDIPAKIVTLVIAVFLWSYVMSSTNPVRETEYTNISVNYTNTSELDRQGLVIMEPDQVKIGVRLSGKRSDLEEFSKSGSIFAQVDLSGYSEGKMRVPITVGLLGQAKGVSILSYEPKEILFNFDKIITKEVPVNITLAGDLAESYVSGEVTSKPEKIIVSGPRTWINEVERAVGVLDVSGKKNDINVSLPVKIVDSSGEEVRGIDKEQAVVDVAVRVLNTKEVPIELVRINELPEGYAISDIEIKPSKVVLKGKDLESVSKIYSKEVDLSSLVGKKNLELGLQLPEGVSLLDGNQKIMLSFKVEEMAEKTITFSGNQIELLNLNDNLKLDESYLNQNYIVNISGFKSAIDSIEIGNLNPKIDLKDLGVGEHEISIIWDENSKFEIKSLIPKTVNVEIIEK